MVTFEVTGRRKKDSETLSRILARAGFLSGFRSQSFSDSTPERNGPPSSHYVRLEKEGILSREIPEAPDFLILLDSTADIKAKKETVVMTNTSKPKKAGEVDASSIALESIKRQDIVPVMLGVALKAFGKIPLKNAKASVEAEGKKDSYSAIEAGYKAMK
ncbi:MAG: 2-oxoacid:acceptor oxidoreductase family protein [Candidatus Aenigmarchaeota archaeon]|nr:2-oxoacid:acceptor oxidoreductase family protein [Candidatus Aenigmarchaeota archaeon]